MVDVAVVGARGYLGRTLASLLLSHPDVETLTPASRTAAGKPLGQVVPALSHVSEVTFVDPDDPAVLDQDVVLLATPGGVAAETVPELEAAGVGLIVDLSRDHRTQALTGQGPWAYGLSELSPGVPEGATHIAGPGCYPTATLVGLAPALIGGLTGKGPLISDGKSGISGAGITPRADLHFPEANEATRAYKVAGHDHTTEIQLAAAGLEAGGQPVSGPAGTRPVRFTPHIVPQTRGLLATAYLPMADGVTAEEVQTVYQKVHGPHPFVRLVDEPNTADVTGSNFADVAVHLDEAAGLLVARCAIDNLIKGGAGSAIQAMNQALGLPETAGLPTQGVFP